MIHCNRNFNLSLIIIDYNFRGIFATLTSAKMNNLHLPSASNCGLVD